MKSQQREVKIISANFVLQPYKANTWKWLNEFTFLWQVNNKRIQHSQDQVFFEENRHQSSNGIHTETLGTKTGIS